MLIDTTLREGAQLFGAYFSMDMKERIVSGLVDLGIEEIELGWVGQDDLADFATRVRPMAQNSALSVWSPCREADVRTASSLPVQRVNIGIPASDLHIENRLHTNREGLLERLARTVLTAKLCGIRYVSVGLEDISRADEGFALKAAMLAAEVGASRVRLSDSLGLLTPLEVERLVKTFRAHLNCSLAVHCHNDFGMATANAVTALKAGADFADVSVLGIGERSGIAATEEVAAYLTLKEESHGYKTGEIRHLCRTVSEAAGISVPRTKAVAGKDIFSCESGIHVHALSKAPELFEPYRPDAVGADRVVAVGGKSGRAAVAEVLKHGGSPRSTEDIPAILDAVRSLSNRLRRPLTTEELDSLATKESPTC